MRQLVMWYVREFTLHVDSKFKLHHGDWVLTSVGTHHIRWDPHNLCLSNQFVPLVYLMCKQHESEGAGRLLLDALNKVCVKYFGKKLEPGATMSDHAAGLKKAFVTVFPDVYHGQCWPHIIRKWGEGEWASKRWEHFDEVGTQLAAIHLAQTTMMRDLLMMEYGVMWDEWGHEMDVFWDSHCRPGKDGPNSGWDNWSIGCFDCVLCTPSQQAQESWHKQLLTTKIPGLGKGSTETVFHKMLPQLIEMDAIMIPTLLCFEVPGVPVEMIKKALWYVDNQNTHIHVFKHDGDDGAHGYYVLRRDHETGVTKITKRLIDMFRMAWQGDVDPRVQDLDHLVDICQGIHVGSTSWKSSRKGGPCRAATSTPLSSTAWAARVSRATASARMCSRSTTSSRRPTCAARSWRSASRAARLEAGTRRSRSQPSRARLSASQTPATRRRRGFSHWALRGVESTRAPL